MIEQAAYLKSAASQIDGIDDQIRALNEDKKAVYSSARETVAPADFKAWKDAVKLRQKRRVDRSTIEAHEDRVADMLAMLEASGTAFAFRAHPHDARKETQSTALAAVDSAGAGVVAASSVPASSFVSDNPDAGNLTASRSTPADGSGFHDPETGEVFEPMTEAELLRQLEAAPETEQPLTEAPPSPSPSVIEEGGAAASAPPSAIFTQAASEFPPYVTPDLDLPDFLRRNKQQNEATI